MFFCLCAEKNAKKECASKKQHFEAHMKLAGEKKKNKTNCNFCVIKCMCARTNLCIVSFAFSHSLPFQFFLFLFNLIYSLSKSNLTEACDCILFRILSARRNRTCAQDIRTNVRSNCESQTPSVDRSTVLISSDDDHTAKRRKIWNIGLTGFITLYSVHSQKSRQRSIRDIETTYVLKLFRYCGRGQRAVCDFIRNFIHAECTLTSSLTANMAATNKLQFH